MTKEESKELLNLLDMELDLLKMHRKPDLFPVISTFMRFKTVIAIMLKDMENMEKI